MREAMKNEMQVTYVLYIDVLVDTIHNDQVQWKGK